MHAVAHRGLRSASRNRVGSFCRCKRPSRIARRQFTQSASSRLNLNPWSSGNQASAAEQAHDREHNKFAASSETHQPALDAAEAKEAESPIEIGNGGRDRAGYTVSARRGARNRRPKELPQPTIPKWFFNNNVKLLEDERPLVEGVLELIQDSEAPGSSKLGEETSRQHADVWQVETKYHLNQAIMDEISVTISAGLSAVQTDTSNSFPSAKSHVRLHCPVDDCDYLLEKIVEVAATRLGADIIRIDAQDIAEISRDYIKDGDSTSSALWTLAYDAIQQSAPASFDDQGKFPDEESEDLEDDALESEGTEMPGRQSISSVTAIPMISFERAPGAFHDLFKSMASPRDKFARGFGSSSTRTNSRNNTTTFAAFGAQPNPSQQWNDLKLATLLEVLLETNQTKRANPPLQDPSGASLSGITISHSDSSQIPTTQGGVPNPQQDAESPNAPRTIVLLRGFKELCGTQLGSIVLDKLLDIVEKKRKQDDQRIIVVGATSSSLLTPELSKKGIEGIQAENQDSVYRTIVVPPHTADVDESVFSSARHRRVQEFNKRSIRDMAIRLAPNMSGNLCESLDPGKTNLNSENEDLNELQEIISNGIFMDFDEVHRVVLAAIGKAAPDGSLDLKHIVWALKALRQSDQAKESWVENFRKQKPGTSSTKSDGNPEHPPSSNDRRIKQLHKTANSHEKVMLRGVVNPENIRTTFNDVHAPPETIEALRTLTMLSLTRPEAFKYGVLATDKLPGCLLYGPPGTGKTLLAKAVAKESGATVLEVSGSDVYDMYVGEAEKNVRAIFTLARKLSPCVVFIDEADAIFATRGNNQRNTHRELINQFLREWDGMNETNAFLMLATNRPFDLDDAALRRLPRRLLVDLPVEKDREAILRIHLKDEQLDPFISITDLAKRTPLYSGSDLKNLAVAAALAAVREENEEADKHTGEEPYQYPEKRILALRHFDKALEEITASVGDDMSSLSAIKKFDEKYGDRRGKKKRPSYGFAGAQSITEETNKVRI